MNAPRHDLPDVNTADTMPPALVSGLKLMIRRVRRIIWTRGLVATFAVLLFSMLASVAVDATTLLESPVVRWGLWGTGFLFTLVTAWVMLVKPLRRPLTPTRMARVIETRHPDLQERISSVLELKAAGEGAYSASLMDMLTREALLDMDGVSPVHEFTMRSARPFLGAFAVSAGILGLLLIVWPREMGALVRRAINPAANVATLGAMDLAVEPGNTAILRGSPLTLTLSAPESGTPFSSPELRLQRDGGRRVTERMRKTSPPGAGRALYELHFPAVSESFSYSIRHGAGITQTYTIDVLPPPALEELAIAYDFPAYTGLAPTQFISQTYMDISAVNGTRMTMTAKLNCDADGVLHLGSWRLGGRSAAPRTLEWQCALTTNAAPRYGVALHDRRHGFTNTLFWSRVRIIEDQPPVIEQMAPGAYRFTVNPLMRTPFAYTLHDDFGVERTRFLVRDDTHALVKEIPAGFLPSGKRLWSVSHALVLKDLPPHKTYSVTLEVTDNLPPDLGGPHVVESIPVHFSLVETPAKDLDSHLATVIKEQSKALKELIEFAAASMQTAGRDIHSNKDRLGELELQPGVFTAVQNAAKTAQDGADALDDARGFAASSVFPKLIPAIETVQRDNAAPAVDAAGRLLLEEFAVRPAKAGETSAILDDASEKIRALLKLLEELEQAALDIAKLQDLADEEHRLAEQAANEQMTQQEMDDWLKEQENIKEQADENNAGDETLKHLDDAITAMDDNTPMTLEEKSELQKTAEAAQQMMDAADKAIDAADKAEDLADNNQAAQDALDAAQKIQDAAEAAKDAAADTTQQKTEDAVQKAEDAAQKAEDAADLAQKAAQNTDNPTLADAAQDTETAAQMAQDAARMAHDAADQMKDALGNQDNPEQAAADQAAAEQKAKDAADLAQKAADMAKDAARQINDEMQRLADDARQAKEAAEQAAKDANSAKDELPGDMLDQAGELLDKSVAETADALDKSQAGDHDAAKADAEQAKADAQAAKDAARQAAQKAEDAQEAQDAQKAAAEAAAEAAEQMQQQAQAKAEEAGLDLQQGKPTPPMPDAPASESQERSPPPRPLPATTAAEAALLRSLRLGDDWMRLKGNARSEALDNALQNVPPEYRELVRMYFLELARETP